ncbi:MAG: DUF6168 family protein [Flavobacteriaceae bacterium]
MTRSGIYFGIQLMTLLAVVAGVHMAYFYANQLSVELETLVFCYLVNFVLAMTIYVTLLIMADKKSKYLGFVFLFGSALKFLIYFLVFDPLFKQDGDLSRVEFFLFFVPYLTSLIVETAALVKLLRTLD